MARGNSKDYEVVIPVRIKDETKAGAKSTNSSVEQMAQQARRSVEKNMSQTDKIQQRLDQEVLRRWKQNENAKSAALQAGMREREKLERNNVKAVDSLQKQRSASLFRIWQAEQREFDKNTKAKEKLERDNIKASESLQRQRSSALIKQWQTEQREFAKTQQEHIRNVQAAAQRQTDAMNESWQTIHNVASVALAGLLALLGAVIIDTALFAGRTDELTIALHQMAKANNLSTEEIDKQLRGLIKLNIARQEATQILALMIGANLDLTKATTLARIAQDTAVISGKNSSEAFQDLANAILLGTTRSFRAAGIFISVRQELDKGAKALGVSKTALTEMQRQQILTNAVVEYGTRLTGTYEAAMGSASKQMRSLVRVVNDTRQSFGELFQGTFMFAVQTSKVLLEVLGRYPKTFLAATISVTLFTAAIVLTSTSAVPGLIGAARALIQIVTLVGKVMVGNAALIQGAAATITVATLGWAALAVAIGVVIYALAGVESATEQAERVTIDLIGDQKKAYDSATELAKAGQEVAAAQAGSADQHQKLNAVLNKLDPVTRTYIETINEEARRVVALNEKLKETADLKRMELEASLRSAGGAIIESQNEIKSLQDQAAETAKLVNMTDQMAQSEKNDADEKERLQHQASYLAGVIVDLNSQIGEYNKKITDNEAKVIAAAKALGYSTQQFVEYLHKTGQAQVEIDRLTKFYTDLTPKIDATNKALEEQAQELANVTKELKGLLNVGELEVESKILDIVKTAKNAAEARKMAQEAAKTDEFRDIMERRKRATEAEKAAREVLEPKPQTKAAIERGQRDQEMIRSMREVSNELAADFKDEFGKAMSFHFGQTPLHTKLGYRHDAAFDISEDPRTREGRFIMEWLDTHGINFRASLGRETSKTTGKLISTGVHIHAGELSGPLGRSLKVNESLLSPEGLKRELEKQQLVFAPWSGQMVTQEEYVKQLSANRNKARVLTATGAMMSPEEAATQEAPALAQLPVELERKWDIYYQHIRDNEKLLAERRRDFAEEYKLNQSAIVTELGHAELDLEHLRAQAADDQFSDQRRLLAAKTEERDLTQQQIALQDELANGPRNEALRIEIALLQDKIALQRKDEDALKDYNRAVMEMDDALVYHAQQSDTAVAKFIAGQKSITEIVAETKIGVMETTFDIIDRGLDKMTSKLGIMQDLVKEILSSFIKLALSQFFRSVFLGQGAGGRSGGSGGIFGSIGNIFRGGAGGGGSQSGIADIPGVIRNLISGSGGGVSAPPSVTGIGSVWGMSGGGGIHEAGHAAAAAGGLTATLGAMLPFLGLGVGAGLGGGSRFGNVLGGAGGLIAGGIGAAFLAPGLFATTGVLGSLGPAIAGLLTNPFTAIVAGGLILGAILLGKNAEKRKNETAREALSQEVIVALQGMLSEAEAGNLTPTQAASQFEELRQRYFQSISSYDSKTKRIATDWWNKPEHPPQVFWKKIQEATKTGETAANIRNRMNPVFAGGGWNTQDQFIKVRPGEGIQYPNSNVVHTVFGRDRGYDTEYMYAPRGTRILNQSEMKSAKPMNTGGVVGNSTPSELGDLTIDNLGIEIDADGLVKVVVSSPLFKKVIVKNVKLAKKEKKIA